MLRTSLVVLATLSCCLTANPAWATSAETDDFQDGTTQGWTSGPPNPNPPSQVADGGPAGSGDGYLLITAHGNFGAGCCMVAFNDTQWTGDFLNSNIRALTMDVRNFSREPMQLRVALENIANGGAYATTVGVPVDANSDWQSIVIPLAVSDLTDVGFASLADTLGNVTRMRILHNTLPSRAGLPVAGTLGIDNIRAIPEPSSLIIGVFAAMLFGLRFPRNK